MQQLAKSTVAASRSGNRIGWRWHSRAERIGMGGAACLETIGIVYRHYWEGVLDSISISFVFDQIH